MWWHMRRNQIASFGQNGRVHLNRRGRQFSRLLAAEVYASAVVMLDTPCSEVVWRVLATHSIRRFLPSLPISCVTVCPHMSIGIYHGWLNHQTSHTVALITHTAPWKHAPELHLVANPCVRRWNEIKWTATYSCDDTRCCIIQFWPPDDEHIVFETCRCM